MEVTLTRELIIRFLNRQCSENEKLIVIQALNTPDGKSLFDEVMLERWNNITAADDISDLQLTRWNEELHQQIKGAGEIKKPFRFLRPAIFRYAGLTAAIVTGLIIFSTLRSKKSKSPETIAVQEIANPYGKRSIITLPDSSVIYLGAGSKVSFPATFQKNTREISLEGEAFFDVKHKTDQPFIVHTGTLQTRDIGTSFKITAFKNSPVVIALASGEVSIEQVKSKSIQVLTNLVPGQQSVWKEEKLITSNISVKDITGWKDGRLVFDGTSLKELTTVLERWYNVKISYKNISKKQLLVTTTLTVANTPVSSIIKALSVTEHFKYSIKGDQILII